MRRLLVSLLAAALPLTLAGCAAEPGEGRLTDPAAVSPDVLAARAAYDAMSERERVGQLFMVGVTSTGATKAERHVVRDLRLGNVFLRGRNEIGATRTAAVTARIGPRATWAGVAPLVATDQEGGQVQALQGRGFDRIPPALEQGRSGEAALARSARTWGEQLRLAGVNLDLAPVADVVPRRVGERNQPIGRYGRQLGHGPKRVARLVRAIVTGMDAQRVGTTLKHFPGIGRATANTDVAAGVTDPTRRRDRLLRGFAAGIEAGATAVMVSSARYPGIDPRQACFSPVVMRQMLRGDLGFDGIVLSDSFDTSAVAHLRPGQRAVRFLTAGGTVVLDVDPRNLRPMVRAVRDRARTDPAFAAVVRDAVLTVLRVKAERGLLPGG